MILKQNGVTSSVSSPCIPADTRDALEAMSRPDMADVVAARDVILRHAARAASVDVRELKRATRKWLRTMNNARQAIHRPQPA